MSTSERPRLRHSDAGLERRCPRCAEYWPADLEFFHGAAREKIGLSAWCKACYADYRQEVRHPAAPVVAVVSSIFEVARCG